MCIMSRAPSPQSAVATALVEGVSVAIAAAFGFVGTAATTAAAAAIDGSSTDTSDLADRAALGALSLGLLIWLPMISMVVYGLARFAEWSRLRSLTIALVVGAVAGPVSVGLVSV